MYWQDWSTELRDVLELTGSTIAITYSQTPASNPTQDKRVWACRAFQAARDGGVVNLSLETSGCPGGTSYLGFREMPSEHMATVADFLVDGEKLMATRAVFARARLHSVAPPVGLARYVVFSALEKAELAPDLVMFICSPLQASRIATLANFEIGDTMDVRLSGSTCSGSVTAPLLTGRVGLSLIDTTCRHSCKYDPSELIVTVPIHLMHGLIRSIERCSAGRASIEWPEPMRELMKES